MQVKGLMLLLAAYAEKHPPVEPLRERWYAITFLLFTNLLCFGAIFSGLLCDNRKIEDAP